MLIRLMMSLGEDKKHGNSTPATVEDCGRLEDCGNMIWSVENHL